MKFDKKYYDDFFEKYPINIHDNPERFTKIASLCKGKVLDLACGTGTLSDYYNGAYVGLDISDIAIEKAKNTRRKTAIFLTADLTTQKLGTEQKFDTIVLAEFLEHIDDDSFIFENIKSLLAPNAMIICSVPNGGRVPDESHVRLFSIPQIRRDYSKYGKITFYNWSGASSRIIFSIEPYSKVANDISLVMIVKDEEKGLETAILSAIELVDNVVISVDKASIDKTAEIAKLYADELKFHEWHDDFSEARNFAQQNVHTKWILFLDGHEYIEKIGHIKNALMLDVDGIMITVKLENGFTFLFPRIYRKYIKFTGKVHNLNECKKKHFEPKFLIVHDRANLQTIESSQRRNEQRDKMLPQIMKQRLAINKKDVRALFHLGNYYMMKHEYKLAISYYKQHIKYSEVPEEQYLMALNKGMAHQMLGQNLRALWSFKEADHFVPDRWETSLMIGSLYFSFGMFKKASEFLVNALGANRKNHLYRPFEQNFANIWDMISGCFVKLDQFPKAVIALEKAISHSKDDKQKHFFETKLRFLKILAKDS